ncbi:catechol O-methyltransferase [Schizosaccharomyces octosporus yFS286]|uniref:catechol O-methyltransferase n=1 Tax=Schizosaccharomyces octosporus (strain yFS286) TaxID=483514 RepID=S9RAS2_SCHOY|nr:catechol O-methyltransferase [Schizosaccharomyces octosporus yFS286]EPX75235.1 catechol O-methyltransferase [Schizosaccharomyces octosporus yFS286]
MSTDYTKEQTFVDHLLSLPSEKLNAIRGKPEEVIKAIHDFEKTADTFYMDVGEHKGQATINEIRKKKPQIMVELGCYLGYSAVLFGKELLQDPTAHYYSLEINPKFAELASKVIELAGLSHKVTILVGPATESLVTLREKLRKEVNGFHAFDFVFIDHWQNLYVPDLRVMESLDLIAPGTILVADNIYIPGAPEYAKYVQANPDFKREYNEKVKNANGNEYIGRWDILYDSKTVPVEFPLGTDAIEITRCIGYAEK